MTEVNVLFINGWGGAITSQSIAGLRDSTVAKFGRKIYAPPPVNHQETGLILRYLEKWQDAQILVGLSCGCSTINAIAHHAKKGERIPYAMYCSPSIWCGLGTVPAIVERATQVTSWGLDFFNPGSRLLVQRSEGNSSTIIDKMQTSSAHGFNPGATGVRERLWKEIERALA
jgi:hypothetical protein